MEAPKITFDEKIVSSYVVMDPSSSRKSIRRLLSQLGAKAHQVDIAEDLNDGLEIIQKKRSQVLFVDQGLVGTRLSELAHLQEQYLPLGSSKALFLLTSSGSEAQASDAADGEVDAVIMRPFTFGDLQERVTTVLKEKFFPQPSQQLINQGVGFFKTGQLDKAFECFKKSCDLDPKSTLTYFHMGSTLLKQGKAQEAKALFAQGLKQNPTHFRCLMGMIDLLLEGKDHPNAYVYARTLSQHHTIPMKRLPVFIKLSVLNQKFDDIFEFQKLVDGIDSVDGEIATYLAAGLVVCALFLLKQKNTSVQAIETFKRAERMARGNIRILTRIIIALSHAGLEKDLNAFLSRMPKEVQDSMEVQVARLEKLKTRDPSTALTLALDILKGPIKNETIFKIAIELSIQGKRSERATNELFESAMQYFPKLEGEWMRLVQKKQDEREKN